MMPNDNVSVSTIAPLRNVALFGGLVERVMNREAGLPGFACFYGPSGLGKSTAATYAANKFRAYHVEVQSVWTRKFLCQQILADMGIRPDKTVPEMVKQIGEQLSASRRPLFIDEADLLLTRGMIEIVRDMYKGSEAAIVLIGEPDLPGLIKKIERMHGRILDWVEAEETDIGDSRHLARLYCRGITVAEDLLAALHKASASSARRICVNLDRVREAAQSRGLKAIDLATYGDGRFFTGNPPGRKS